MLCGVKRRVQNAPIRNHQIQLPTSYWSNPSVLVLNTASKRLRRTCWLANCCDFLRPPPRHRSDWAERGAGGRSLWRRWCRAVGCGVASARLHLPPASWRTDTIRRRCCSTGDRATSWFGRVRPDPEKSRRGRSAVNTCGSGRQGSS